MKKITDKAIQGSVVNNNCDLNTKVRLTYSKGSDGYPICDNCGSKNIKGIIRFTKRGSINLSLPQNGGLVYCDSCENELKSI